MRTVTISKAGGPETLKLVDAPDPTPGRGEVVIEVEAAGVNFADILARMGLYPDAPPLPFVPGYEVAGRLSAIGPEVDEARLPAVGEPVMAITHFGGYASSAVAEATKVFPLPEGWTPSQGAAFPVVYLTAWLAVVDMGRIRKNDKVLVHGAAGGVGIAATQIARHFGAEIFGTASSDEKLAFSREQGVDHPINYRSSDFAAEVRALTGTGGLDLILDPVGGETTRKNVELLAPSGRVVLYGVSDLASGERRSLLHVLPRLVRMPKYGLRELSERNVGVFGLNLLRLMHRDDLLNAAMSSLLGGVREGWLAPVIDSTFPLEEAAEAHRRIQSRRNVGKVLLTSGATDAGAETTDPTGTED